MLLYGRSVTTVRRFGAPFALAVVLVELAIVRWTPGEPIGIDFHTYEAAARVGLEQGWSHIYDQSRVGAEQAILVPGQTVQPFLSPPPVAWLAAVLAPLPYWLSYYTWAAFTFIAFGLALIWASTDRGLMRWVAAGAALTPWWLMHAVHLCQVVPLVAAGVLLAWRLARERRDIVAAVAFAPAFLNPHTAILVPFALLVAGRFRTFAAWAVAGVAVAAIAWLTMGSSGVSAYIGQLTAPLPAGANSLTLEGALGVSGSVALALRLLVVVAALAAAFRLRQSPGLAIP